MSQDAEVVDIMTGRPAPNTPAPETPRVGNRRSREDEAIDLEADVEAQLEGQVQPRKLSRTVDGELNSILRTMKAQEDLIRSMSEEMKKGKNQPSSLRIPGELRWATTQRTAESVHALAVAASGVIVFLCMCF